MATCKRLAACFTVTLCIFCLVYLLRTAKIPAESHTLLRDASPEPIGVEFAAPGFHIGVRTNARMLVPDISKQLEFRTSQLAVVNGKVYPSRRVLYTSTARVEGVVVLPIDAYAARDKLEAVLEERRKYCGQHGYGLYARYIQDFAAEGKPAAESLRLAPVRMLRQAMEAFPQAQWFWLYDPSGRILDMHEPMLALSKYLQLAIKSEYTSEAASFYNVAGSHEEPAVIVSSDTSSISTKSVFARQELASKALLELMTSCLMQEYPQFVAASEHGGAVLTHLLRWHTELAQRIMIVAPSWGGTGVCSGDSTNSNMGCLDTS